MQIFSSSPAMLSSRINNSSPKKASIPSNRSQSAQPAFAGSDTLSLSHHSQPSFESRFQKQPNPAANFLRSTGKMPHLSSVFLQSAKALQNANLSLQFAGGKHRKKKSDEDKITQSMADLSVSQQGQSSQSADVYYTHPTYPGYIFRKSDRAQFLHKDYPYIQPVTYEEAFPQTVAAPATSHMESYAEGSFPVTNRGIKELAELYPSELTDLFDRLENAPSKIKKTMRVIDIGAGQGKVASDLKKLGLKKDNVVAINNQVENPDVACIDLNEMPEDMYEDDERFHLALSTFSVFEPGAASKEKLAEYLPKIAAWLHPGHSAYFSPADPKVIGEVLGTAQSVSDSDHPIQELTMTYGNAKKKDPTTGKHYKWVKLTRGEE